MARRGRLFRARLEDGSGDAEEGDGDGEDIADLFEVQEEPSAAWRARRGFLKTEKA